jgi:hypothetical protein
MAAAAAAAAAARDASSSRVGLLERNVDVLRQDHEQALP